VAGSNAIKMGRAFVQFFVEDNLAYRALDRFGNKFKSWGASMRNMGAALGAGGGAILAPLLTGLSEATSRASELQQVADRIGEGVTATSTLAGGFERVGVSAEQFGGIVEQLKIRVAEAADSHGYLLENLKSMGPATRIAGLGAREQLNAVADAIQRIPNAVGQLRAAKSLGLESILPQLKKGRAGIDELFASGGAGAVSGAEGAAALEATRAMTAGWVDFKDAVRQVGMALLPTAEQIKEWRAQLTGTLTRVREWVAENRGVVVTAAAVGVGLVAAGVAVVGLGVTVAVTGKLILLTVAAVKLAFGLLLSPIGAVVAGVAAITVGMGYLFAKTDEGRAIVSFLGDEFVSLGRRAKETFGAISDAIGAGDWRLAWKIGLAALKAEWLNFTFYLQVAWNVAKSMVVDTWRDAVAGLKLMFIDLGSFIAKATVGVLRAMLDGVAGAIGKVSTKLGNKLREAAASIPSMARIEELAEADRRLVVNERNADQRESDAHRQAAADAARDARDAARNELTDLQKLARWRAEFAAMPWLTVDDEDGPGAGGPAAGFSGMARLADAVKGVTGSSAAIGQQLGYGDTIPQRQLDAAEATRDVLASNLPQMARDMNALAGRGRVQ